MPDQDVITQMVSSPQFAQAPIAEQRKALAAHNPIFNQVGDADLIRFTKAHQMGAQANRIPTGAPSPAAVAQQELLNRPKPEFTSAPERFLQSALPAAGNMAVGLGKAAIGGPYATAIQGIMQSWRDSKNSPSVQDLQGRATGIDANELGSQIQSGNYAGAAGSVAPTIAATLFGGRIAGKASKGARFPSRVMAGAALEDVKGAIGTSPVDVSQPGNIALRIKDIAGAGASAPKVVTDFIRRVTDPAKGPLTFAEARDFYSNASERLSMEEQAKLTPKMKFQLSQFTRSLGKSIQDAAEEQGQGGKFTQAMREYRSAAKGKQALQNAADLTWKEVKSKLPWLATAYAGKKIVDQAR